MQTKLEPLFRKHERHADRVENIQQEINGIIKRFQDRIGNMSDRFDSTDLMLVAGVMGRLSEATYPVHSCIDFNAIYSGYNDKTLGKVTRKHLKSLEVTVTRITEWQKELTLAKDVYDEETEREGTSFYYDTWRLLRQFKMTIRKEINHIRSNTRHRRQ